MCSKTVFVLIDRAIEVWYAGWQVLDELKSSCRTPFRWGGDYGSFKALSKFYTSLCLNTMLGGTKVKPLLINLSTPIWNFTSYVRLKPPPLLLLLLLQGLWSLSNLNPTLNLKWTFVMFTCWFKKKTISNPIQLSKFVCKFGNTHDKK